MANSFLSLSEPYSSSDTGTDHHRIQSVKNLAFFHSSINELVLMMLMILTANDDDVDSGDGGVVAGGDNFCMIPAC